jgi:hypothetical protein
MKPIKYILELCDPSEAHRPIAVFTASTPFPSLSIGDRFDDEGWPHLHKSDVVGTPKNPCRYIVHSVKHVITETDDAVIVRSCLNLTHHDGPPPPAGDDQG